MLSVEGSEAQASASPEGWTGRDASVSRQWANLTLRKAFCCPHERTTVLGRFDASNWEASQPRALSLLRNSGRARREACANHTVLGQLCTLFRGVQYSCPSADHRSPSITPNVNSSPRALRTTLHRPSQLPPVSRTLLHLPRSSAAHWSFPAQCRSKRWF